ncbi:MAG: DUF5684 domain-containing protein [Candidatus Promineifilaceae bacterium]|nr:DUF5684 domain-containing protein [Candidatus Promineifilaceae bacterium]
MTNALFLAAFLLQNDDSGIIGALFGGVYCICWGIFALLVIAGLWKVYVKAGQPGWAAIIPIYNIYVLTQIIGRPWWWLLLLFIPFVNIVVSIIMAIDLAKSFGKDAAYGVLLLWLFSIIGYLVLGFGDAQYQGPAAAEKF